MNVKQVLICGVCSAALFVGGGRLAGRHHRIPIHTSPKPGN